MSRYYNILFISIVFLEIGCLGLSVVYIVVSYMLDSTVSDEDKFTWLLSQEDKMIGLKLAKLYSKSSLRNEKLEIA